MSRGDKSQRYCPFFTYLHVVRKIPFLAEYMQSMSGDLVDENCSMDCEMYEESTLEERLIAMRGVIHVLENNVNENYEKFKVVFIA